MTITVARGRGGAGLAMAVPGYEVAGFVETIMQMVPVAVASAIGMGACLIATRALFPTVAKESHDALAPSRRFFVSQCVVSGLHALVSGPAGTAVLQQLLFSDPPAYAACPAQPNLATVAAPPLAVWTCGFTCGYFVYDSIVMLVYPEFTRAELGNPALMCGLDPHTCRGHARSSQPHVSSHLASRRPQVRAPSHLSAGLAVLHRQRARRSSLRLLLPRQ